MVRISGFVAAATYYHVAHAACPYGNTEARDVPASHPVVRRDGSSPSSTDEFLAQFEVNDTNAFLTNQAGVPIEDQESLSAGERGPTLLEDFVFREKIMHFGKYRYILRHGSCLT